MVGSLNYLAHASRPDIAHAVNCVCRYASNSGSTHMTAVKRIMRYFSETSSQELTYSGGAKSVQQPLEISTW